MKETLRAFILFIVLCMLIWGIPNKVSAATVVSTLDELRTALAEENTTNIELGSMIKIDNDVNIDGNNKNITTALSKAFEITGGTVNFNNITIVNTASKGRCIDVRDTDVTLILDKVTLKTTSTGNNQTLNIGGNFTTKATINVKNSTISAGQAGYGIIAFNPVNLTIDNSDIKGYAAIYMKGMVDSAGTSGSVINIQNGSVLRGINNYNGDGNNFGTIVFEDGNIAVNVKNSEIIAGGTGTALSIPFLETAEKVTNANKVTLYEGAKVTAKTEIAKLGNGTGTKVTFKTGATSNKEIPKELLDDNTTVKVVNGEYVVEVETPTENPVEIPKEDNGNQKDESPKMGIEETTLIIATIVATIALVGLIITGKRK